MTASPRLCPKCQASHDAEARFCPKCGANLAGPGGGSAGRARDLGQLVREELAGRFELERELGRGGMSVVYLARDLKHDRQVAIKVLPPDLTYSVGIERFVREIQIVARLQHPNI